MAFDISDTQHAPRTNENGEQVMIDTIRQRIICGDAYYAWDNSWNAQSIPVDGSWNAVFYSGGSISHKVKLFAETDSSINYRVWELAAAPGATGTALSLLNYNRASTNTCSGTLKKGKYTGKWAQIAAGTEIRNKAVYASNTTGPQGRTSIGSNSEEYSFITDPDKYYVLHIHNRGPNALHLHVHLRITESET